MFFAPQADVPLSGKAWGLRVKYDCSIVRDVSELTILSQKPESTLVHVLNYTLEDGFGPSTKRPYVTLQTPDGDEIYIFNTGVSPDTENVWAYTEMGTKTNPDEATSYDGSHSDFDDVTESMVLEYAIWQVQYMGYEFPEDPNNPLPFNTTISPAIKGMGSPFIKSGVRLVEDDGFFEIRAGDSYEEEDEIRRFKQVDKAVTDLRDIFDNSQLIGLDTALSVAAPMGVRCVVSSGLGAATLDGVTSTFSDFERVDPDVVEDYTGESIFGERVIYNLGLEKFFEFYQISHLPASVPQGTQYRRQGYVHPQALQEVLMLGYGTSALDFMYNINPSPDSAWLNPDVWASEEGKILTQASLIPGTAVGYLVLALFCIWSVLSAALGIVYGFRKRPSDKLDGESVFRRGVDMSEDVKHDNEFQSGKTFYANKKFQALPGS
ncbi:hypothetical protein IMZ48_08500 [Candidatus Bathyarchaeota archaeon]|nr:hypothetical protein [Candidatus Bathyarchaeota archaeon]